MKSRRKTIISCMIAIAFIFPTSFIMFPVTQSASAFPTSDPLPSEYLFYDDFETGVNMVVTPDALDQWNNATTGGWFDWGVPAHHGAKSLAFNNASGLETIARNFGSDPNENVVFEVWLYDGCAYPRDADIVEVWMKTGSGIPNETIGVGVYHASPGWFNYRYNDSTTPSRSYDRIGPVGMGSDIPRYIGMWHNIKILALTHTTYTIFMDGQQMGNVTTYNSLGMESFGVTQDTRTEGYSLDFNIDQAILYRFYQDPLWNRQPIRIVDPTMVTGDWASYVVGESTVLYEGGVWRLWFGAINENDWAGSLGYAHSHDGLTWSVNASALLNTGLGYHPFICKIGSTYYCYVTNETASPNGFKRYTSTNGYSWTGPENTDILTGASGSWKEQKFGNNCVWKEGSTWYMMFEALGDGPDYAYGHAWREGLATSTNGLNWNQYAGNPVLHFSSGGAEIHKYNGTYYALFHGDVATLPSEIYLRKSTDLIEWTNASFYSQITRAGWDINQGTQIADPSYCQDGGKKLLFASGTGTQGSDENGIYVAQSDYTLEQIGKGEILQWGKQWIGDIGVTNNITGGLGSRTYWYSGINAFKGTYFYDWNVTTTTDLNITILVRTPTECEWNVDAGAGAHTVTFTLTGLQNGRMYNINMDGGQLQTVNANAGVVTFTYSGPWSEHQFEVITVYTQQISAIINLIFIMFATGIVVGVIAEGVHSLRKKEMQTSEQMMKMLVSIVIYIVVGIAGLGVLYKIVA